MRRMIVTVLLAFAATSVTAQPGFPQGSDTVTDAGWCCRG
jgi:hypothetical protein